jgi:hypothetical protein
VAQTSHALKAVVSDADRRAYHEIRRDSIFAVYRSAANYDPNHPDETKPGNLPHVLTLGGDVIGTIRIDLLGERRAAFRLIAIRNDLQRRGHGSELLLLAERRAQDLDVVEVVLNAVVPALPFYRARGYAEGRWYDVEPVAADVVRVGKRLNGRQS